MNIIFLIILILTIVCADFILYKKLSSLIPKQAPVQSRPSREEEATDNRATYSEQRYMEGIENVLNYDVDTMKKHLRGEDEA